MAEAPLHKTDLFKLSLQAYYDHLNTHGAFARALNELFRTIGPNRRFTRGPLTESEQQAKEQGQVDLITGQPPTEMLLGPFKEFCEDWPLPKRAFFVPPHAGIPDLWFSYMFWAADPEEAPELRVGIINTLVFLPEPVRITISQQSFNFDPSLTTGTEARKKLEELLGDSRKAGLEQIREGVLQGKAMGRLQHLPPHRNEATRVLLAKRFYQRVVLKTGYAQIAKGPPPYTERTVKQTVSDLSQLFGIPLPGGPGRPPEPNSG